MNKKLIAAAITAAAGTVGVKLTADIVKEQLSSPDNKRKLLDIGHKAAMGLVGKIADSVSDKGFPYINRYDNTGFLEGNGYFIKEPAKEAKWYVGFAKASVVPPVLEGDYYIGGYLAFPPNKMNGIMNEQMVRAMAISDNSGRGIHVFAVIDCIGISGTDIRDIRNLIGDLISEKNILSVNISATHCHSGIDTDGLWGDLPKAFKHNKKEAKKGKKGEPISGKNKGFMTYLKKTSAKTIRKAVENMTPGELFFAQIPIGDYVRDKRPPYVTVNDLTSLRFVPENGGKEVNAVFMAAHPVCYGYRHREASRDFPGYLCDRMDEAGVDSLFIQGAEAAVATNRGPHIPDGLTTDEGIKAYGEAIADYVMGYDKSEYKKLSPVINVTVSELFLRADNKILELGAKLRLVNNPLVKITMADDGDKEDKSYELFLVTEVGFAVLGNELSIAMVPGELIPEIAIGGAFPDWASYHGKNWDKPSLKEILGTEIAVAGLCNDFIGYIVPDNDYGSIFAPLHYEEAVSAGEKTASNIVSAFIRMKENADKITVNKSQIISE
ncbi:MAG: hypothetical protein IKL10_03050 [Clostridia bacterium]|nr:hypothetical protein [Clostridia bacterium]